MRNTRRYGGYVVHFGMVLVFIGIAGSAFNKDIQMDMAPGQTLVHRPVHDPLPEFRPGGERQLPVRARHARGFPQRPFGMMLYPQRRLYLASQVTETMVAVQSSPLRDLYVVYAGRNPDTGKPVIHAYLNPLVKWIWFGGIVVVLGTGLAMLPNRRAAIVLKAVQEKSWGDAVPATPPPAGRPVESHD